MAAEPGREGLEQARTDALADAIKRIAALEALMADMQRSMDTKLKAMQHQCAEIRKQIQVDGT